MTRPTKIRRILLAANNLGGIGGIGTFMRTMAESFSARGYDIGLIGFDQVDAHLDLSGFETFTVFDRPTPESLGAKGLLLGRNDPRFRRRRAEIDALRQRGAERLARKLPEYGAETALICTQVFAMENFLRAGFDPFDRSGPLTFGQHHSSFEAARAGGYLPRILSAFAGVDRFVALTEKDAERFTSAGVPSATAIPNPVTLEPAAGDPTSRAVLTLGRYSKEKRLDRVIHAWARLRAEFPDWRLELWGEGELRGELKALIDELGLDESAELMGATTDVAGVLSRGAIHVLSSDAEGLPLAIVEAARRSVPTVAMDCAPGISSLIEDGVTGRVVAPKSVMALIDTLRMMMRDGEERTRMGEAARAQSMRFLPEAIVARWEAEFERALR